MSCIYLSDTFSRLWARNGKAEFRCEEAHVISYPVLIYQPVSCCPSQRGFLNRTVGLVC